MNPELHAFFLDPSASGHFMHAELSEAYRRACDQTGAQPELIAYTDEFEFLLEEIQDYLRDENEYPEYTSQLADFRTSLRAIEIRSAQVSDLQIEIRQRLEEIEDLRTGYSEGLRTADDPYYESWRDARERTLAEVERLRADPDMVPHLDRVLTNLPELANAVTPATLAEAATAPTPSPEPANAEASLAAPSPNAAGQPAIEPGPETPTLVWAGIGSRQTPPAVLADMTELAGRMAEAGWHLASGGADGADTAFAAGTPGNQRTIWLPWPRYNGLSGPDCLTPTPDRLQECLAIAERLHPAWEKCSDGARQLHARNVAILLGPNLDHPVDVVVCWTEGGAISGGTGMGLRIAAEHGIPVFNLGSMTMEAAWDELQHLQRSLSAADDRAADTATTAVPIDPNTMARVVHLRDAPPDAIRIDRRTAWGNPFQIGPDGTREEVIAKYRDDLWKRIGAGGIDLDELASLHGKDLACHCAPLPCHGDALAEAAAWVVVNKHQTTATTASPTTIPSRETASLHTSTRTYDPTDSCVFRFTRSEWGAFSNFFPSIRPIAAAGHSFATSEHLYQAAKFRQSPRVQARIAAAGAAKGAVALGRDKANTPDSDWNDRRIDAMRWVIRMKREANPELIDAALQQTGDRSIVEFSRNDSFWGARPQGDQLVGQNILGRLWMELRQHIRDGDPRALASAWDDPVSPKAVARANTVNAASADTWQRIKMDYSSLYRASGDRLDHIPYQEGFAELRDLVAGAVENGSCPSEHQTRLKALHNTLETQHQRHNTVLDAQSRLDNACARLEDLNAKIDAEHGHTIETVPGYTAWLRERDAAVAHWHGLAEDPAHKEHMQIVAPDMLAPRIAELSNETLTSIHQPGFDYPAPSSGQGVYTPSLQPLSQVYGRALAFVDRDPNLLPYAPQFDELKIAVSDALDKCSHTPDLVTMLTKLRTTLDENHERMTRAQAATEDVANASHTLCGLKAWADRAGRPIHEAPDFKTCRTEADRALHHYEAAEKDPTLVVHLARADSLGVLTETAVPMLRDSRFREPVASEASLAASRQRSEQAEEHYSMSA